jgi:uncharacterized DUF497 family protein
MRFTWSDAKRKSNLQQHGLDFVDAPRVFDGPTYTYEDDHFDYSKQRFVTLGVLEGVDGVTWSAALHDAVSSRFRPRPQSRFVSMPTYSSG